MQNTASLKTLAANKGKKLEVQVRGETYLRLPIKTPLITVRDNIFNLIEKYVVPYLKPDDIIFISEKALTITQGRIINMNDIKVTPLARFLSGKVDNKYGTKDFRGFGHGTPMAMQLFIEQAGVPR